MRISHGSNLNWKGKFIPRVFPGAFVLLVVGSFWAIAPECHSHGDEDDISTPEEARALQSRIIDLIDITRRSVVGVEILVQDEHGRMEGIAGGSGVIIDAKDGIILTAGHVGRAANLPVRVYLDDGSMLEARTLGQHLDGQEDCGLIKIDADALAKLPPGSLQALPLGDSSGVEVGDWVLAYGHALGIEKSPWRPPPARIGRITGNHDHVLTMDAPLNSGDSGGPLIDLEGNIIGINESCAGHPFENAATAVKVAIERMDAMLRGESSGASLPDPKAGFELNSNLPTTHPIIFDPANEFGGRNAMDVRSAFEDATWDASDWSVRVYKDGEQIALGMIVNADGFVVTKASEVDPRQERILVGTATGLLEEAVPIGIDTKLDLLLLRLPPGEWIPAPLKDAPIPEAGSWVVSAGPDAEPISFGICGLDQYDSNLSILDRAFLGVRVDSPARGATGAVVQRVVPGCAARRAGLLEGDVILAIDDIEVSGSRGLVDVLASFLASDIVEISFRRGEEELTSSVRLGSRVFRPERQAGMFIDYESGNHVVPVSRRDTGFGRVIQHDGLLRPEQCGGPLVDLDGRLVGINIARSDRTKTFAIPVAELRASIERMSEHSRMTKTMLSIDPRTLQVPIRAEEDGAYFLRASDAQLFGPTARYFQGSKYGSIGNWMSSRDEVLWVIDSPVPGAYLVHIEQACAMDSSGGRFSINSNRDSLESVVRPTDSPSKFERFTLGEIEVGEEECAIISIRSLDDPRLLLMNLRSIELIPVLD